MSILIKNMEMPTTGLYFVSVDNTGGKGRTVVTVERMLGNRDVRQIIGSFELVPVPPHGDLIDRDYVKEHLYACETNGRPLHKLELCELLDAINDIPAILPAEEGET